MLPPCCEICEVDLDPPADGDLVTFAPSSEGSDELVVGGADDAAWFCTAHLSLAREHTASPRELAIARIVTGEPTLRLGRRFGDRPPLRYVACTPVEAGRLHRDLVDGAELLLEAVGVTDITGWTSTSDRTWNRVDGCEPPWCPHTDEAVTEATGEQHHVRIAHVANRWDDDHTANASSSITIRAIEDGALLADVTGSGDGDGGRTVTIDELHFGARTGPLQLGLVRAVLDLVGRA